MCEWFQDATGQGIKLDGAQEYFGNDRWLLG
jgi:hypothetical protein